MDPKSMNNERCLLPKVRTASKQWISPQCHDALRGKTLPAVAQRGYFKDPAR